MYIFPYPIKYFKYIITLEVKPSNKKITIYININPVLKIRISH